MNLKEVRTQLGHTQAQMAAAMGMPLRSYQDIEGGANPVRPIHEAAARWAMIVAAANGGGLAQLPPEIAEIVARAAR